MVVAHWVLTLGRDTGPKPYKLRAMTEMCFRVPGARKSSV